MSSILKRQATEQRIAAISELLASKDIGNATVARAKQVDAACAQMDKEGRPFTIRNLTRVLKAMYSSDYPAESTIRNRTNAGNTYRGVLNAWRTYRIASTTSAARQESVESSDLSDALLNEIRPESARLTVLMMRTSLRNLRRQYQILQTGVGQISMSEPKVPVASQQSSDRAAEEIFTAHDVSLLRAFVDESECAARGVSWDLKGQLLDSYGSALSRPGLKVVLDSILKRHLNGSERK